DPHLMQHVLVDANAPRAAPGQGTKPHLTVLFVPLAAALDGEPRVVLVAGGTAAATEVDGTRHDRAGLQVPLARPGAREVAQRVVVAGGQVPARRRGLVDSHRLRGMVLDMRRTA